MKRLPKLRLPATTTRVLKRFSCAHTVGHGFKQWPAGENPVGSPIIVYGFNAQGMACELPVGGVAVLGKRDVQPGDWPEEYRRQYDALPDVSILLSGEQP